MIGWEDDGGDQPARIRLSVYLRESGDYLGTYDAADFEEAIGLAIAWHGYDAVLEAAGLESLTIGAFEVIKA